MSGEAQQTIGKIIPILAPNQQSKINVNGYTDNVPIGPGLMREGITSNLVLSQKRADNVMQFMISRGVNPSWCPRRVSARKTPWPRTTRRRAGRRTGAWN
jgi:chemotaxis protein MotB